MKEVLILSAQGILGIFIAIAIIIISVKLLCVIFKKKEDKK